MKDGIYSTDSNNFYDVQGIYVVHKNILFFLANPKDRNIITDHSILLNDLEHLEDNLFKSVQDDLHLFKNITTNDISRDSCFLKSLLHVDLNTGRYYYKDEVELEIIALKGILISPNCGLAWNITDVETLIISKSISKASKYVLLILSSTFIYILLLIKQMNYTSTQTSLSKISLLSIAIQSVMDSFLCLIHLMVGISFEPIFKQFALASFLFFVGFSVFEMRYIILIWKARRPQAFSGGWEGIQRELSVLYLRFYGFLVFGFLVIYYFNQLFIVFVFILYSFWIPQIFCNATRDSNRSLKHSYVIGASITRLILPIYFYGFNQNFARIEPFPSAVVYLIFYMALQVAVLFMQDKFGPRFFLPKNFLPESYNYRRQLSSDFEETHHDCVICMSRIDVGLKRYMLTPCNHIFHQQCLMRWLEQKMECPSCRSPLPQPSQSFLNTPEDQSIA